MASLLHFPHNQGMAQLENFRIKVFRVVAKHLSFRKAAEQLFLTQRAVILTQGSELQVPIVELKEQDGGASH